METETTTNTSLGRLSRQAGDRFTVQFERHLQHPVHRVWQALTDPAKLALWLAEVQLELRPGGKLHVAFTNTNSTACGEVTELHEAPAVDLSCKTEDSTASGQVTEVQENAVLEYTWQWDDEPVSVVRWELQPLSESACLLRFSHRGLTGPLPSFSAGWHGHLELLEEVLNGARTAFAYDFGKYEERYLVYEQVLQQVKG